ncbi:MAG TPA: CoA-transferase, partial [Actinomycetota bacterium]|nr:CoA-transferase [Actinomycetota bacterium]
MRRDPTRADYCVVACAEAWRGDGEILASPMGVIPTIGARLARATFEPDLLVTDGEAFLVSNPMPLGHDTHRKIVEGWLPFRSVFEVVAAGKRHVMMGASQLDRFGNQNISCIGEWAKPKVQLLGVRGAPGNTVSHPTSYWVPNHSPRVFVERVDMVSGVGGRRAAEAGPAAVRFNDIRRVVTNLGVLDFEARSRSMRLGSLHPGVTVADVVEATGFELIVDEVAETRKPTDEELELIRDVLDPEG